MIKQFLMTLLGCGDCTKIKQQYEEMYRLAHYDSLTGLANRLLFDKDSARVMATAIADNDPMTVFLVDLDNFKMINDTHGHQAGNQVLAEVAHRLSVIARARCDIAEAIGKYKNDHICKCVTARLGGDEFVVVFENMDKHEADIIGQQIVQQLKQPISIGNFEINVSASIGGSIYPWDGHDVHTLLKAADLAMYTAKEYGKDRHMFYERSMNTKVERRVEVELAVREMITTNNINVYYQPIVETDTGEIIGAEALLRGNKTTDKVFSPVELITAAEDTNLIIPLGATILRNACRFARRCLDIVGEDHDLFVSVNVSAFQLTDPTFAYLVEQTLHDCDLTPDHLVLEITETMLMQNFIESERMLEKLRDIGVRISIDDFGKGYSSFSYLQKLPIDKIKIDMSFIKDVGMDQKANEIVKGIILMADALGMHTCAEGVETELQWKKLLEYGCEQVQGYYKSKALSEQVFVDVLKETLV